MPTNLNQKSQDRDTDEVFQAVQVTIPLKLLWIEVASLEISIKPMYLSELSGMA
jgi:hypothetical protein